MNADDGLAKRRRVRLCEHRRHERPQRAYGAIELATLEPRTIGRQRVHRSVQHHAAPLQRAFDLIDLEGHVGNTGERIEFRAGGASHEEPAVAEHVMHRLDVDAPAIQEAQSSDVIATQHGARLGRTQRAEDWTERFRTGHDLLLASYLRQRAHAGSR